MGLDQYARVYRAEQVGEKTTDPKAESDFADLYQWRKHPNLQGWMEGLYRAKGGTQVDFNTAAVRLESEDLDELEEAVVRGRLPMTEGFFFGKSRPQHKAEDLEFIARARDAIQRGLVVFYDSWW